MQSLWETVKTRDKGKNKRMLHKDAFLRMGILCVGMFDIVVLGILVSIFYVQCFYLMILVSCLQALEVCAPILGCFLYFDCLFLSLLKLY